MYISTPTSFVSLLPLLFPASFASSSFQSISPIVKTIFQFPNPTWVENIASTSNGSLLVSLIGVPELHIIHPSHTSSPATASLVHSFTSATSVFGITELRDNIFAVITGNFSLTAGTTVGSYGVWTVDLISHTPHAQAKTTGSPTIRKIANLPTAGLLNGAAALNPTTVLLANAIPGNIIALNVRSGRYETVLQDQSLAATGQGAQRLGVNGLKIHAGFVYYSNTLHGTLSRVAVDPLTGRAIGPFTTIAANVTGPDDLAVADNGTVYLARPSKNQVVEAMPNGRVHGLVGNLNSSIVAGVTSATLGRVRKDRGVIYVATNGGLSGAVNGTFVEGGKVVGVWV